MLAERSDYVLATWRYAGPWTEWCAFWGGAPSVTWCTGDGAVGVEHSPWVERWRRRDGAVVRVEQASAEPGGWASSHMREADVAADGRLVRMRGDDEPPSALDDDTRLGDDEWRSALLEALTRAAGFNCPRVVVDYRVRGQASLRRDTSGMAEERARALAAAASVAAAVRGPEAPFCVAVSRPGDAESHRPLLPPVVRLAGDAWRRGMVATSPSDGEAVRRLWRGEESEQVVRLELAEHLEDAALLACRELSTAVTASAEPGDADRATDVLVELADRLTVELARPARFPSRAELRRARRRPRRLRRLAAA